jgi:hypothetical protein|nr:MAG TPA: hypothetical protein [Caudoviricetes sp.]
MTLDEAIAIAKKVSEDESADARGRKDYRQIAEWLEELKQYKEQNQETNLDHFQQEILEKGLWNLAVVKGRPERCDRTKCLDCELSKDRSRGCHEKVMDWLKQQYIKPTYKLTKFERDLLQSCPSKYMFKYIPVLCRMKEKGYFKGVDRDATSKDILADCEITEED